MILGKEAEKTIREELLDVEDFLDRVMSEYPRFEHGDNGEIGMSTYYKGKMFRLEGRQKDGIIHFERAHVLFVLEVE